MHTSLYICYVRYRIFTQLLKKGIRCLCTFYFVMQLAKLAINVEKLREHSILFTTTTTTTTTTSSSSS